MTVLPSQWHEDGNAANDRACVDFNMPYALRFLGDIKIKDTLSLLCHAVSHHSAPILPPALMADPEKHHLKLKKSCETK